MVPNGSVSGKLNNQYSLLKKTLLAVMPSMTMGKVRENILLVSSTEVAQ